MDASPGNAFRGESIDIARLVRQVVWGRRFANPRYCVIVQVPETPVWVLGDRPGLERIVNILLDLACQEACVSRVIEVFLELGQDAGSVRLRVAPHNRAGESAADELTLLRTLAESHGGGVEGEGAAAVVRLPVQRESAAVKPARAIPTPAGEHHRVLVIEDNRDGSATLRRLLELAGHEVQVAYTGLEGLRVADSWRPDFVFCDIGLPELDGYRVADELRRKPTTAGAHLIAITGYGSPEDRERSHGTASSVTSPSRSTRRRCFRSWPPRRDGRTWRR